MRTERRIIYVLDLTPIR